MSWFDDLGRMLRAGKVRYETEPITWHVTYHVHPQDLDRLADDGCPNFEDSHEDELARWPELLRQS
jgi:hypothetical protein